MLKHHHISENKLGFKALEDFKNFVLKNLGNIKGE